LLVVLSSSCRVGRSGQRSEEASIIYVSCNKRCLSTNAHNTGIQDTNVLGFKGPRKMTASIPAPTAAAEASTSSEAIRSDCPLSYARRHSIRPAPATGATTMASFT
jgi:hypothetical protein